MPFHVFSNTGTPFPFFIEEGVSVDGSTPVVVDELSDAMKFQINNLRVVEVDDDGNPVPLESPEQEAESVDPKAHASVVKERDSLASKLDKSETKAKEHKEATEAAEARVAELEAEIAQSGDLQKRAEDAEAEVETLKTLIPTTRSGIQAMGLDDLKTLAQYRGVSVTGDGKAAYVDALAPKQD